MQELDIAQKVLEDHKDVFADIVNGLLFQGREVVKVTDLEGAGVVSSYKATGQLRRKERDVAEYFMHLVQGTEYNRDGQELHYADEVLDLLHVMTGDDRFEEMQKEAQRKKEEGEVIMKNWILDEAEDRGIEKGQRQAWAKSIRHMRLTRNMTEEEAFEMLNVPQEERNKIKELLDN